MKKKSLIHNKLEIPKLELGVDELLVFSHLTNKKTYEKNAFSSEELKAIFYKNPIRGRAILYKLKYCIKSGVFQEGMLDKHDILNILEHTNAYNMLHAAGEYNDLMSVFALGKNRMLSSKFLFLLYSMNGIYILNQLSSDIAIDFMKSKFGDEKPVPIEEMIKLCIVTGNNFQNTLINCTKEKYLEKNNCSLRNLIAEIKQRNLPYTAKLETIKEDQDWDSDVQQHADDTLQEKEESPQLDFCDGLLDEIDICRDWNFNYDDLPNFIGNHSLITEETGSRLSRSTDSELDSNSDYSYDLSKIGASFEKTIENNTETDEAISDISNEESNRIYLSSASWDEYDHDLPLKGNIIPFFKS